jgi:general L-amino acid transport system permease protein
MGHTGGHEARVLTSIRIRGWLVQAAFLGLVVGFGFFLVHNTLQNLESRGISTGFGFLSSASGFGILQILIDYSEASSYGRVFVVGLLNTLLVSALGIVLATLLGFVIGVARLSKNWLLSRLAAVMVETFRNIPLLLQIFFWYFVVVDILPSPRDSLSLGDAVFLNLRGLYLPKPEFGPGFGWVLLALVIAIAASFFVAAIGRRRREATGRGLPVLELALLLLIGLPALAFYLTGGSLSWELPEFRRFNFQGGMVVIPELMALLLALVIYTSTFIAEIVRAGIQSVPKGQTEAAMALGLSNGQRLRLILIPQALRVIIPPLTSQYLNLMKNSSLATAIGYPDLVNVFAGTTLNNTGQAVEVIAMTMAVYLSISLAISLLMNAYNARIGLVER